MSKDIDKDLSDKGFNEYVAYLKNFPTAGAQFFAIHQQRRDAYGSIAEDEMKRRTALRNKRVAIGLELLKVGQISGEREAELKAQIEEIDAQGPDIPLSLPHIYIVTRDCVVMCIPEQYLCCTFKNWFTANLVLQPRDETPCMILGDNDETGVHVIKWDLRFLDRAAQALIVPFHSSSIPHLLNTMRDDGALAKQYVAGNVPSNSPDFQIHIWYEDILKFFGVANMEELNKVDVDIVYDPLMDMKKSLAKRNGPKKDRNKSTNRRKKIGVKQIDPNDARFDKLKD